MNRTTWYIIEFILAAILVIALGALAGWYFFVDKQIDATEAQGAARSFGASPSFGSGVGSAYQNLIEGLGGDFTVGADAAVESRPAPRLWRVAATPVGGFGFSATSTQVFFAERATGNILRADVADSSVVRLTNTLKSKVQEAHFADNGYVVLRSLSDEGAVESFAGELASTTPSLSPGATPHALGGTPLPRSIRTLAAAKDGSQLVFLVPHSSGGVAAVQSEWDGTGQETLWQSPLQNWQLQILGDGSLVVQQNAADDVPGYAFFLQNGALQEIAGDLPGLSVLPQSRRGAQLYSISSRGTLSLFVRAAPDAAPVRLPIRTITDKCVWSTDSTAYCAVPHTSSPTFMRDWYRGALHTTDALWRVDAGSGTAALIYTPPAGMELDMRDLQVNAGGTHVGFINNRDGTLYVLRIEE